MPSSYCAAVINLFLNRAVRVAARRVAINFVSKNRKNPRPKYA